MEYKTIKLKEIADIIMGQSPKGTSYNSNANGVPFLQGNKTFGRLYPTIETWTTEPTKIGKKNSILMSVRAPVGALNIASEDICIGRGLCSITMRNGNTMYLYYLLANSMRFIKNRTSGTVFDSINRTELEDIDVIAFDEEIQSKIETILTRIDKKIELNNQTNDNLHELVNLIYLELFGDKNIKVERLGKHAECILGGTPSRSKPEYWNGNINWINSGEVNKFRVLLPSEKITELGLKKSSTTLLPQNTTVLAITGATLGQVSRLEIESCANQSVVGIVANKDLTNNYIYLSILNHIEDIIKNQTGGAQQHINKGNVEDFKIYIPTESELKNFEERVSPLFDKISVNCKENVVLEQLRDTLLPKLMNGEIDLDKIEI